MAMLQVRDVDDRLYDRLKFVAKLDNRSISQQVTGLFYFNSHKTKKCHGRILKTRRFLGR